MSSFASANLTVGQLNALVKTLGGEPTVRGILDGTVEFQITKRAILEHIGTVDVPGSPEPFVVGEHFRLDLSSKAPVKISYIGDNFKTWFGGTTEKPKAPTALRYGKLLQPSKDTPIIAELGGEEKSETTLAEMFYLMGLQGKGEVGVLLNNGSANIFYVRDRSGALRTVRVFWDGDGWNVFAIPVGDPYGWRGGSHVFSRIS